jgi:hypothetical protein
VIFLQHVLEPEKCTQYQLLPVAHATFGHDLPSFSDFPLPAEKKIPGLIIFNV